MSDLGWFALDWVLLTLCLFFTLYLLGYYQTLKSTGQLERFFRETTELFEEMINERNTD